MNLRSPVVAWSLAAVGLALNVLFNALDLANGHRYAPPIAGSVVAMSFLIVGALVATRRPRNPIGWLYLIALVLISFGGTGDVSDQYAVYAVLTRPGSLPAPDWIAWAGQLALLPAFYGLLVFSLLLLPDGQLRSRRWRAVAIAGGVALAGVALQSALLPGPLDVPVPLATPVSVDLPDAVVTLFGTPLYVFLVAVLLAALSSLLLRFRDARGVERQQLKWFAYGAVWIPAMAIVGIALATFAPNLDPGVSSNLWPLSVAGIPLATGIAILRYRLYDIDLLINRTLVYGATTAAIGVAFFAGIVVLQSVLRPLTGGSELAVAISTLACFALFQPVRRRIQRGVDRRFYRSRYDAPRTLDAFSDRLANEVDLDAVSDDLLDAAGRAVQPATASLWLREPAR